MPDTRREPKRIKNMALKFVLSVLFRFSQEASAIKHLVPISNPSSPHLNTLSSLSPIFKSRSQKPLQLPYYKFSTMAESKAV